MSKLEGNSGAHSERAHALLAASHAERWLNCTPSARLEEEWEKENPGGSSTYAEEGTLAHELAEILLREKLNEPVDVARMSELKANPLYSEEMLEYVTQYVDYVMGVYSEAKENTKDAAIFVEKKLDFSNIVKEGFGTGDACIIPDDVLHIIDLKFGKGVKVNAERNPQLMLYALGALNAFDVMFDITEVCLHVAQPRLDHFSTWTISVEELKRWATNEVVPRAELAYAGKGVQKAGAHCKFCKVKAICSTLASNSVALAKMGMGNPYLLTEKQLIQAFEQIPSLLDWANSVNEYLLKRSVAGNPPRGYKVVEGRSQRKWSDEDLVVAKLAKEGYTKEQFMTSKLAGIGAIEKLVGKKEFPSMLGDLVVKPQGSPTLVKEEDPRPALQSLEQAKADFSS